MSQFPKHRLDDCLYISSRSRRLFEKVKQYEALQRDTTMAADDKKWAKKILLLAGADDEFTGEVLDTVMPAHAKIIADTLFGADVYSYNKHAKPGWLPEAVLTLLISLTREAPCWSIQGIQIQVTLILILITRRTIRMTASIPFCS